MGVLGFLAAIAIATFGAIAIGAAYKRYNVYQL